MNPAGGPVGDADRQQRALLVVWCGGFTVLIALAIKYTIGWRIAEEDEVEGIDFAEHGETAYDLATSTSRLGSSPLAAAGAVKEGVNA